MSDQPPLSRSSLFERVAHVLENPPAFQMFALRGLFILALVGFLYVARDVFIPLALALMLSFIFRPIVRFLERLYVPRALGGAIVLVGVIGALSYGAVRISDPAIDWFERLPKSLRVIEVKTRSLREPVHQVSDFAASVERITGVEEKGHGPKVSVERAGFAGTAFLQIVHILGDIVVTLTAFFFMLVWGDTLLMRAIGLVPDLAEQRQAEKAVQTVERRMTSYLATVTSINVGLGLALAVGLQAVGMPNPLLWGTAAALLTFIPYLGALVGIVLVGLAALVTFETSSDILTPPGIYLALATIEGQVLTPLILGRTFQLNPLIIFLALVFWGWLWGVTGALLAVPGLVFLKVTCEQSVHLRPLSSFISR